MNKLNTSYNSLGLPPKDSKPNINQRTAEIYNYVTKIIQEAKANGDLAPGENLNIEGIVGQILQESGNGMSDLTLKGNNFGGIKADNNWGGEVIKMGGATYRKFATPEEGLKNQVYFYIDNPRYRKNGVMQATTPEEHLKAVQKAGYAGDPNYVANTMKMVNSIQPRLKKAGVAPMPTTTTDAPVVTTEQLQTQVEADLTPTKLKTIPVTALTGNMQMPTGPVEMDSQYGSQAYVQKVPQAQEQDIEIPTGWFGSGKSLFNYGGNLNSMNMRSYNRYAGGGPMEQLTQFNAGGLHEENPLGGIPQGMSPDGQMNLVEQGETKLNSANYVFSDKLKVDKAIAEEFNLPKSTIGKTFSEASKKADRPHSRREGDDIETKAKQRDLDSLMQAQEAYKQKDAEQKIAELQALHPEAFASLVGQQGGMPQGPEAMGQDPMAMGQEQMPPMSEEEAMMMQQQMAMQGVPQSYGGQMYAFGGNMKNPEAAQKWSKGLGMAAPFLNFIPGVGQIASVAASTASAGLGMAANNAMAAQSEQEAMLEANRMGNDYGGATPPINPALGYAYGGYMGRQFAGGGYGLNSSQLANIGQYPTGLSNMQKRNVGMPMGLNYGQQQNVGYSTGMPTMPAVSPNPSMPLVAPNSYSVNTGMAFGPTTAPTSFAEDANGDGIPDYLGAKTTDMAKPKYDVKVDDNYKDLTVDETAGEFIGKYAPAAVNLARGLFEKVEKVRPEDFYTKIDPYRMDFNPARRDAEQGFAGLRNSLAGAGPGAGSYMTNMQNAAMMRSKAMQDINAAEENAYQQSKFQADATNASALTQAKKDAYSINLANRAAKNAIFNQGLTDVSDIAKANQQNKLATSYYSMMAPDFAGSVGFNPYFSKKRGQ